MNFTVIFSAAVTAFILIVDTVICYYHGKKATISVIISKWSRVYPFIPFLFGILMGHFFAQDDIDFSNPAAV